MLNEGVPVPIMMTIHEENGTWWAQSTALPGFSAAANSREELIERCEAVRLAPTISYIGPMRYGDV